MPAPWCARTPRPCSSAWRPRAARATRPPAPTSPMPPTACARPCRRACSAPACEARMSPATGRFDHARRYPSARVPVYARDLVATSHPLAAQAGLRILGQGGTAIDAAIAAAAVMTLVEPCSNGLGSDAFAIVWDGERLHGLNASGHAPAAWTPAWFRARHGEAASPPRRGWDAVPVPGAVGGWAALHERFGALPFAD